MPRKKLKVSLSLSTQIPEDDLHYTVALTEVSGDGQLASSSTQTSLTVGHNDDPINLRNSTVDAREGETVELVVTRAGHANGKHLCSKRLSCVRHSCYKTGHGINGRLNSSLKARAMHRANTTITTI